MRDLDLTSRRLFVAVCETRNIARAVGQQAIMGSAIPKRLAALESTVGTQLRVRRRHSVDPTRRAKRCPTTLPPFWPTRRYRSDHVSPPPASAVHVMRLQAYAEAFDLRVIPLTEPWAQRHFAPCHRPATGA